MVESPKTVFAYLHVPVVPVWEVWGMCSDCPLEQGWRCWLAWPQRASPGEAQGQRGGLLPDDWGKGTKAPRRGAMRRPGATCGLETDGELTEPRACLPQGWTRCKIPLGPWAELLWQDREWRSPSGFPVTRKPLGLVRLWVVLFFFFSYFLKCLNSVSSSWYPLDSGHLRQENKLRQE